MTNGNEYDFVWRRVPAATVVGPLWVVFPGGVVPPAAPPCLCGFFIGRHCPQCLFAAMPVTTTSGTGDSR